MSKEYTRDITIFGNVPIAGPIIINDDFEDLLLWTKFEGAGDSIFELDPSIAKHGNQCLSLKTRTTGTAEGDTIGAIRQIHLKPTYNLGFINSFLSTDFTKAEFLQFRFILYTSAVRKLTGIRYYPATPVWKYESAADTFTDIPNSAFPLWTDTWHQIALQANFSLNKYISLSIDHLHFDLSSFSIPTTANATAIALSEGIYIRTAGAAPANLRLDEIIIHEI